MLRSGAMSPVLVLVAASVLWGLTWWPLKQLYRAGVEGLPLILVGYSAVAASTVPLLWRTRTRWWERRRMLLLIAALGGMANVSFACALVYGDVVRVMVLFYLLPLWGVLGGRLFLGEPINRARALAMLLALAGAFLVLGGPNLFAAPPTLIDLVAVVSGFTFAMNNIAFRASQSLPVSSKVAAMFFGCAFVAGLLILAGVQTMPAGVSTTSWCLVVAFGFGILLTTSGTQYGVNHLEAGRSSIIMILELLSAAVSSAIITARALSALELVGGMLIIGASLLEARAGAEPPPAIAPQPS